MSTIYIYIYIVDKFTYFESSISSTENDINLCLAKAWTAIDNLSLIWKSDLFDKIKRNFFQAVVVSVLLYRYTITGKKLDSNCTKIL